MNYIIAIAEQIIEEVQKKWVNDTGHSLATEQRPISKREIVIKEYQDSVLNILRTLKYRFRYLLLTEINEIVSSKYPEVRIPSPPTCKKYIQELVDKKYLLINKGYIKNYDESKRKQTAYIYNQGKSSNPELI